MKKTTLLIDCKDEMGLIAKVTGVLYDHKINILINDDFTDMKSGNFFIRIEFAGDCDHNRITGKLKKILPPDATIRLIAPAKKKLL